MQVFVRLHSGKTVCIDVTADDSVQDVLDKVNELWRKPEDRLYKALVFSKAFYAEEHPMTVLMGTVLNNETKLTNLYERGIIKEVVFLV
jgi:hypothetical protein